MAVSSPLALLPSTIVSLPSCSSSPIGDGIERLNDSTPPVNVNATISPPLAVSSSSLFRHQVAGHGTNENESGRFLAHRRRRRSWTERVQLDGILPDDSDAYIDEDMEVHESSVLKPMPAKAKGRREERFYDQLERMRSQIHSSGAELDGLTHDNAIEWISFFPRCYSALIHRTDTHHPHFAPASPLSDVTDKQQQQRYLHLEDLTACYTNPSLIDIKIGRISHDPFECSNNSEKAHREAAKCPSQARTGCRFCGARIWNASKGEYEQFDKHWGRGIGETEEQIDLAWWSMLGHKQLQMKDPNDPRAKRPIDSVLRLATHVLPLWIERLKKLHTLCRTAPMWRFYASSLLFAYELEPHPRANVHLIDFGHAYNIGELPPECSEAEAKMDENYIAGLDTSIAAMERMIRRAIEIVGLPRGSQFPRPTIPALSIPRFRVRPLTRRKLRHAVRAPTVQRKSIAAAVSWLQRQTDCRPHIRVTLSEFNRNLPVLLEDLHLHRSIKSACAHPSLLRSFFTPILVQRIIGALRRLDEFDEVNPTFTLPSYTTDLLVSHGHPRTRQWRAELMAERYGHNQTNPCDYSYGFRR